MATITAILSDTDAADLAVERLATLNIDDLDWELYRPQDDPDRVMPALAAPISSQGGTSTGQHLGLAVVTDFPEDELLERVGVSRDEAAFYGQSMAKGATIVIVDVPAGSEGEVRRALAQAGATRISAD